MSVNSIAQQKVWEPSGLPAPKTLPPPPKAPAITTSISQPAQFLSEMQQLSQQEPTRFNTVARQVAASFRQAASQASGVDAQSLTHLATQFALAAQSGRLQPLPTTGSRAPDPPRGGIQSAGPSGGSIAPRSYRPDDDGTGTQSSVVGQAFQTAAEILAPATGADPASSALSPPASL
ncbi:MAG: hypothetical protein ABSF69_17485 [Polyangiaceae bacterium]|jgi:hypothetical protein